MTILKKILISIFIVGLLTLFIRSEYMWESNIKQDLKEKNYDFITSDAYGDLAKPWHWFKIPVNIVYYTMKNDIFKFNDSIMIGHIFRLERGEESREDIIALDCKNKKCAFIKDIKKIQDEFNTLEWSDKTAYCQTDIIKYYYSKTKNYFMVDVFGRDVDISNYILSGLFYLEDSTEGFKAEMFNPKPYKPIPSDEKVIKRDILNWLKDHYPNESFEINDTLYEKIKYRSSQVASMEPTDYYNLTIKPNERLDSIHLTITFSNVISKLKVPIEEISIYGEDD